MSATGQEGRYRTTQAGYAPVFAYPASLAGESAG